MMNNSVRLALAAAVLAGAALLGYTYLVAPNVGDRTPAATESPSPAALPAPDLNEQEGSLTAGSYSVGVGGQVVTFTVPSGWTKNVVDSVVWSQSSETRIAFGDLASINTDPCRRELGSTGTGTTVGELEDALVGMVGVDAVTSDVTVSGFEGRLVELTVPELVPADCTGGEAMLDDTRPLEPGVHSFWIVDVGGDRLVIHATARTASPERERSQLEAIVESVEIR
jgi:hypothetical protein